MYVTAISIENWHVFCSALIFTSLCCSIPYWATRHCLLLDFPLPFSPEKPEIIRLHLSLGLHSFHLQWIMPCKTVSLQWDFGCHCYELHLDYIKLCTSHYKDSLPMAQLETAPRRQVALPSSKSAMLMLLRPFCCGQSCCTDKNSKACKSGVTLTLNRQPKVLWQRWAPCGQVPFLQWIMGGQQESSDFRLLEPNNLSW